MKTAFLLFFCFFNVSSFYLDKNDLYSALSGDSSQKIDQIIVGLNQEQSTSINKCYKGALLAKRADFETTAVKKINKFKAGVKLLEVEIEKFPNEVEYRFLRLCIQENCPKVLKYNKNISEDVKLIERSFSKQSKKLRTIIFEYAKSSNALNHILLK